VEEQPITPIQETTPIENPFIKRIKSLNDFKPDEEALERFAGQTLEKN
jgi:hypothetical protein